MKNLTFLTLFTLSLFLSACSDDDPCKDIICQNQGICIDGKCDCPDGFEGDLCQEKKLLLKNVFINGILDESYEYNSDRSIAKKIKYENSLPFLEHNYTYTSDSIIVKGFNSLTNTEFSQKYNRISDDQIKLEDFYAGQSSNFYSIYSQYDQQCGFSKIQQYSKDDILGTETIFEFVDDYCSTKQKRTNTIEDTLILTVETINDNKKYYGESTTINYLKSQNRGNTTVQIAKYYGIEILKNSSYISTFTYNEDLYPSEEKREYENGNERIITYEYY